MGADLALLEDVVGANLPLLEDVVGANLPLLEDGVGANLPLLEDVVGAEKRAQQKVYQEVSSSTLIKLLSQELIFHSVIHLFYLFILSIFPFTLRIHSTI